MYNYKDILVDRRGATLGSNMTTNSLIDEVEIGKCYKVTMKGFQKVVDNSWRYIIPKRWSNNSDGISRVANILGDSQYLVLDNDVEIPVADSSYLWYYGVKLLDEGEVICFETDCDRLPLFDMEIGFNYVSEYIMKIGGGVYLEKHERPHLYICANEKSGGYLCLGKECSEGISISAFKVPFGKILYIPDNVIHNDCFLTGEYKVIYSKTKKYNTLLLVDKNKDPINVTIKKNDANIL